MRWRGMPLPIFKGQGFLTIPKARHHTGGALFAQKYDAGIVGAWAALGVTQVVRIIMSEVDSTNICAPAAT